MRRAPPIFSSSPSWRRDNASGDRQSSRVTDRSVRPQQFGRFLKTIFNEWIRRDVGQTFVLNFDGALAGWLGMAGTLCIFGSTCGQGLALEDNGDLYSCDHFVEPDYLLGQHSADAAGRACRYGAATKIRSGTNETPCRSIVGNVIFFLSATANAPRTAL